MLLSILTKPQSLDSLLSYINEDTPNMKLNWILKSTHQNSPVKITSYMVTLNSLFSNDTKTKFLRSDEVGSIVCWDFHITVFKNYTEMMSSTIFTRWNSEALTKLMEENIFSIPGIKKSIFSPIFKVSCPNVHFCQRPHLLSFFKKKMDKVCNVTIFMTLTIRQQGQWWLRDRQKHGERSDCPANCPEWFPGRRAGREAGRPQPFR